MEFLDARRLTGPSLLWDKAGSILDIRCSAAESAQLIPVWERQVRQMLESLGWEHEATCHWLLSGGVSLAFSAPIDALYTASAVNEWAWACCDAELNGADKPDFEQTLAELREQLAEEINPGLLDLESVRVARCSTIWLTNCSSISPQIRRRISGQSSSRQCCDSRKKFGDKYDDSIKEMQERTGG